MERLEVPGGTEALRRVTNMPSHVTDDMVLVEAARAWYGMPEPLRHPSGLPQRLLEHLASSTEPAASGPALPLTAEIWTDLLDPPRGSSLALALASNREAMLLYHGLMGMDDDTLQWIASERDLLEDLLSDGAAAFAIAGASIQIVNGSIALPGGAAAAPAWQDLVGAPPSPPEDFVRRLMRGSQGRLAWMFDVLSALDGQRRLFAMGAGGEHLRELLPYFAAISPEWILHQRPFLRPSFDPSLVLLLIDPPSEGALFGSRGFWSEVFRTDELDDWREPRDEPLTAPDLLSVLFGERPYGGRDRWLVFAFGQRIYAGTRPSRETGIALRAVERFPALGVALERSGVRDPALLMAMFRAAERVMRKDANGRGGELPAWQSAVAIVEAASLRGGLDRSESESAYRALAALPANDPAAEVTEWLLNGFVPKLLARSGAPASAERALLQTMTGALTAGGPRVPPTFLWEDLSYAFVPDTVAWRSMETVRAAQESPTLDDALSAWRAGRAGRKKAATIVARLLPAIVYALQQAASDTPALGADLPFRHELAPFNDGPVARRRRPWLVAIGDADSGGWHLKGSLLSLDLALPEWYVNRRGEPPATAPGLDEPDILSLSTSVALAAPLASRGLDVESALAALDRGRAAAAGLTSERDLDAALRRAQIDPWRRRALRLQRQSGSGSVAPADVMTLSELWQLGGAGGALVQRWVVEGCACFGSMPRPAALLEGRRATGIIGAIAVDGGLRVGSFLRSHRLPMALFGAVFASAVVDVIHGAEALRPDDPHAAAAAATAIGDARLEEHVLGLVSTGALARP